MAAAASSPALVLTADMRSPCDASLQVASPNGGPVSGRMELSRRFADRLSCNHRYSRKTLSYQGNRGVPGFRWMKYKEGFSREFVASAIQGESACAVLDPFAGICTAPLVAAGLGLDAMGIEIMPVGIATASAISSASNGVSAGGFRKKAAELLKYIDSKDAVQEKHMFPHVRITEAAFSDTTEEDIARARVFIASEKNKRHRELLDFACMSVLEEISFTRKDGQYLRWDGRSRRTLRSAVDKGYIPTLSEALGMRIRQMHEDVESLRRLYGAQRPMLVKGSSLEKLRSIPSASYDLAITSPPYVNRYDYTRTYALELAWLGLEAEGIAELRQSMLSATVENRSKANWLRELYGDSGDALANVLNMCSEQGALQEVLSTLRECENELSNKSVIRMIDQYFLEMAVIVSELGRIVRSGGAVYMVNDNVQYHGEEVPVDFILSDFAEQSGFKCSDIWMLERGKGNSSQQMARFGRKEIRKCVYRWERKND